MARWKLTQPHYLKVPGVEWEQQQTSQQTGKTIRYRHEVPLLLNPDDPGDWTDKANQEIVVCWEGLGEPRDITFFGNPTPDMEPLDAEAKEISKKLESSWKHPIDTLPGQGGFGEALLQSLQKELTAAIRNAGTPAPVTQSLGNVDAAAFAKLQQQVAQLMEQNMLLQAQASGAAPVPSSLSPSAAVERRA